MDTCSSPPEDGIGYEISVDSVAAFVTGGTDPVFDENYITPFGRNIDVVSRNNVCDDETAITSSRWRIEWTVYDDIGITKRGSRRCQEVWAEVLEHFEFAVETVCNDCPDLTNVLRADLDPDHFEFQFEYEGISGPQTVKVESNGPAVGLAFKSYGLDPDPECKFADPEPPWFFDDGGQYLADSFNLLVPDCSRLYLNKIIYGNDNKLSYTWVQTPGMGAWDLALFEVIGGDTNLGWSHRLDGVGYDFCD